jgi:hypothetical protein
MTQQVFHNLLSREEKELLLNRAHFSWPGISARGFRKVKSLIWVVETTAPDSRTAEILASKMGCHVCTYRDALLIAHQLGVISVIHEPGNRSTFCIDWNKIIQAGECDWCTTPKPEGSDLKSEGSDLKSEGSDFSDVDPVRVLPRSFNFDSSGTPRAHVCMYECNDHVHGRQKSEGSDFRVRDGCDEDGPYKTGVQDEVANWWGRDQPLSKADLVQPESIERLFEYAVNRGRFERNEFDRLRFEALCIYCVRRGHIPGALLTRCVFGEAAGVRYLASGRDEDAARKRIRERTLRPASQASPVVTEVARQLSLPAMPGQAAPPPDTRTPAEKILALREWAEAERRREAAKP